MNAISGINSGIDSDLASFTAGLYLGLGGLAGSRASGPMAAPGASSMDAALRQQQALMAQLIQMILPLMLGNQANPGQSGSNPLAALTGNGGGCCGGNSGGSLSSNSGSNSGGGPNATGAAGGSNSSGQTGAVGTPPSASNADQNTIKDFIGKAAAAYGADPRVMTEVARRESNFQTGAVNNWDSNAKKGTPSKGLFQFIEPTFKSYAEQARKANPKAWEGLGPLNWLDWRQQALAAAWAMAHGHGSAWSTYRAAGGH